MRLPCAAYYFGLLSGSLLCFITILHRGQVESQVKQSYNLPSRKFQLVEL